MRLILALLLLVGFYPKAEPADHFACPLKHLHPGESRDPWCTKGKLQFPISQTDGWVPAFAGMTEEESDERSSSQVRTAQVLISETATDLELVLAIDASGSVDDGEFRLQMRGIAQAFRDAQILKAIKSGPTHRIAVCIVVWAEHQVPKDISAWHIVESDADAERFARLAEGYPRTVNGATGMGEGLAASLREIEGNGITAPRQIVDISGDGRETPAREYVVLMPQARSMAAVVEVTVNGLAILGSEEGLLDWYANNVLVGSDSFVESANDYADFAKAIKRKLLREIENTPRLSRR